MAQAHRRLPDARPSPIDAHPRRRVRLLDAEISYVDVGSGDPIVLLHGNPTWSYLWRNIIGPLKDRGRCLAPDLVGMGQSGPAADGGYRFVDHARYLDAWFDEVVPDERLVLVLHDWGSALGFHWACRHPDRIKAIAYMEAIVLPRRWEDLLDGRRELFERLRSPEGEPLVVNENFFLETILPQSVLRPLTATEMNAYRDPFRDPASRAPMIVWPRELPIGGEPADVVAAVERYGKWLARSEFPKLLIKAEPGSMLIGRPYEFCRAWPNQREETVAGIHFIQEDAPVEIADALLSFLASLTV